MSKKRVFCLSTIVLAADQFSKWQAMQSVRLGETYPVLPGFSITLRHNTGAAFSFLAEYSGWQRWFLIALAASVSLVIACWLKRLPPEKRCESMALTLILGGALGNLFDRILHGYVVDFILLYYKRWEWPAFNIADSAIFIGATLYIWSQLKQKA